ncbi:hypothetical protein FLA105535_04731 [Flavobacterium bizetiae]|nr:hypothetical protein FLA105535_04731 [Flavobacterium bizetiae]CAD5350992.1 hypothetical protein FLA105534_04994 [Flavobacterium bizetiae]
MNLKKKISVNFILILVIFFVTNDSFTFGTSENSIVVSSSYLIYAAVCFYIMTCTKNFHFNQNSLFVFGFLSLSIFLVAILNQDLTLGYGVQILTILTAFLISQKIDFKLFVLYFEKILYFLCYVSLVMFVLLVLFPFLVNFLPTFQNSVGVSFINVFVFAKIVELNRNSGIFREPGVFMIYINIGILIQLFFHPKIETKKIAIYIITLMTTLSTAGFLVFFLILMKFIFRNNTVGAFIKKVFYVSIAFLLVSPFLYLLLSSFDKLGDSDNASMLSRVASVIVPIRMSYDSNFLGVGLTKFSVYFRSISREIYSFEIESEGNSTNTTLNLLATYGILYCFLFLRGIFLFSRQISKGIIGSLLVLLIFILMLGNEDMRYSLLILSIMFYGYNSSKSLKFDIDENKVYH